MDYRVTLEACVAGNPLKAWKDGEEPNDVWEDHEYGFDDLELAKEFIRSLDHQTTTHVELEDHGVVIYTMDAGDDLDQASVDFQQQSQYVPPPDEPPVIPEVTLLAPQGGKK